MLVLAWLVVPVSGQGGAGSPKTMTAIVAAAVSPDGRLVAAGGRDGTIRLFDAKTGGHGRVLLGHRVEVVAVAFVPGGRTLAGADADGGVLLWDVQTGERAEAPRQPGRARLNCLACSHDGATIAVGDQAGSISLHDARTGAIRRLLDTGGSTVHSVAFGPGDAILAWASGDGTARLWDAREGRPLRIIRHGAAVRALAFVADGGLATAGEDGAIRLWDFATGAARGILAEESLPVRVLSATPDGRRLAAAIQGGGGMKLWDLGSAPKVVLEAKPAALALALALSDDGRRLVAGGGFEPTAVGFVEARDVQTGDIAWKVTGHPRRVTSIRFVADDREVLGTIAGYIRVDGSFVEEGHVEVWDARTARPVRPLARPDPQTLAGSGNWALALAVAPDGRSFAVGRADSTIQVYDLRDGRPSRGWSGPGPATTLAFSPDGLTLLSGHQAVAGRGAELVSWRVATGEPAWRESGAETAITAAAFSPDGGLIAVGGVTSPHNAPGDVGLRDARTGQSKRVFGAGPFGVGALAFAPDGGEVAALFRDGTLAMWDVRKGEERWRVKGHPPGFVAAIAFASDGNTLASASLRVRFQIERPGEVKLWDARTGATKRTLIVDTSPACSAAFSTDVTALAVGREDGTMTRVDLGGSNGRGP